MSPDEAVFNIAAIIPVFKIAKIGKTAYNVGRASYSAARGSKDVIEVAEGGITRIQNAANRINKPIHLVESRAEGTAKATSDFDYVIQGIGSEQWFKIKNSLPGAPSRIDIDLIRSPLEPTKPSITINPP